MLDKRNQYNFDKKFVNSSWKEMKQMLDNDIPVPNNSSDKLVALLACLLVISSIAIAYLLYNKHSYIPATELIKEKIIYKNIYLDSPLSFDNSKATQSSLTLNNSENQFYYVESPISENKEKLDHVLIEHDMYNTALDKKNDHDFEHHISSLPRLDLKQSFLKSDLKDINPGENIAIQKEVKEKKNKIGYSVGLLKFVSNNFDYSGYGFTSGINIPISKKLGLQTGLAINFVSREYFIFPILDKNNAPSYTKAYADLNNESTYYDGLKSFKQIYVPLNISYKLNNALSVSSGVKLRYTYSEEIDNILKTRASKRIAKSETVANAFFNNTYVGLNAGISYKVNDRLNFMVDSEWGVTSIINQERFVRNPSSNNYDLNLINLTTNISF